MSPEMMKDKDKVFPSGEIGKIKEKEVLINQLAFNYVQPDRQKGVTAYVDAFWKAKMEILDYLDENISICATT